MRFQVISTFNAEGLELYGRRMIESFNRNWPSEVQLRIYSENWDEYFSGVERLELLRMSSWLADFKRRHAKRPTHDYLMDAVRFSHKIAALLHAVGDVHPDTEYLIWMDGDVYTHSQITLEDLEWLAPAKNEWISWLDRKSMYPECGFYILNLRHPMHGEMIEHLRRMYEHDELFSLDEWHDSYVLQQVVLMHGPQTKSLSGIARVTTHPLVNGVLGKWFDHLKGPRKHEGRSRKADLKMARTEDYWK